MTLEDPVEYPMTMIRQTSVNEAAKLDFANGIRSMMRQDPDVILVGEIRDQETAEMAFRAAMTGHQVYSTLHTNSALGAFPRLLDIGILPDIMAGNIIGVIAQRLVRRLCRTAGSPTTPTREERRLLGARRRPSRAALYRAVGCEQCDYQGYKGRRAIMEILKIDAEIDELIARRATAARDPDAGPGARASARSPTTACALVQGGHHEPGRGDARGRPHRPRDWRAMALLRLPGGRRPGQEHRRAASTR